VSSRMIWRITGAAALLSTLLFVTGFVYAMKDILYPAASELVLPPVEAPAENLLTDADKIQIVVLGDSLTRGTGDQSGQGGYVGRVKEYLEKNTDKPVYVLNNFSVNGYRTDQLLKDIKERSEVPASIAKADLVMLTIGGNDIFGLAMGNGIPTGADGAAEIRPEDIRQRMPEAVSRLREILDTIAALNSRAAILYIGLYNPFIDMDTTGEASLIIDEWNREAFKVANQYRNMTVVPTHDLFERHALKYLYSDHFHPNQDGYQRIAERIIQALE